MLHPIIPSLAVAAIGFLGARLGDALLQPVIASSCKKTNSAVVWKYDPLHQTAVSSKPRRAAKRVDSRSPR
jgi:3-deoxy-D-arabino-heptulosonate 7-phosphate (DAHP) synthase class II